MVKSMVIAVLFLFSGLVYAAEDIGKEINVVSTNGKPSFGFEFAHDTDTGFFGTLTFNSADLTSGKNLCSLAHRMFDANTQTYVTNWVVDFYDPNCEALSGTYPVQFEYSNKTIVTDLLKRLSSLKVVLAVNFAGTTYKATQNVDLAPLCKSNPENFTDLTTSQTGCAITPAN